jgi:zinc transport system substrate-binding protein
MGLTRIVLVLLLLPLGPAACGGEERSDGPVTVSAAFYPLAFAAESIGAETVVVSNVTPPGAEPHDVELTPRDVERIRDADLVLYLGGGFQPAVEQAAEEADGEVVDALEGLELLHAEGAADPHVWLDPRRYAGVARRIGDALGRPAAAARFADRLAALDGEFRRGLRSCARRQLVTSHIAFAYLADRYGLEQVAISGVSPEAEPTPRELEDAVERVRESGATTIFVEPLVAPDLAKTVAREAGVATSTLDPIEGLGDEQLARGEDYFTIMRANLAALRHALGCR